MKCSNKYFVFSGLVALTALLSGFTLTRNNTEPSEFTLINRQAKISPDYSGITIPPNIAPLNFKITEAGNQYFVKIHSSNGNTVNVSGKNGKIIIPAQKWKSLLWANRGEKLFFDIYVNNSGWHRYETIENTIAKENIDSYVVYRLMNPVFSNWGPIGIYQRNLENYKQSAVMHGKTFGDGCLNCHSFLNNNPDDMLISTRSDKYQSAVICVQNNNVEKIGTRFAYTSWHPSGKLVAYATIKVRQFFHMRGMETRDVVDLDSSILYYDFQNHKIRTAPALSEKQRLETYPEWSPDGKFLYYCSSPILWQDREKVPPDNYDKVKYDLRRISYDIQTDIWGEPETVLSAEKTGLSILMPRISPDGKFLVFCMADYGCFPIYQPSSDLYIMNLQTGDYRKLEINSEYSESYHSWSSSSRWIAFSSRRNKSMFTRTHFSYVDENGKAHKPFVMPQKDPEFYDKCIATFSVPELIKGPVKIGYKTLGAAARSDSKIYIDMPITSATPVADPNNASDWQQCRK